MFQKLFWALLSSPYLVEDGEDHIKAEEVNQYCKLLSEKADEEERDFWENPVPHTPEARLEAHRYIEKKKGKENRYMGFLYVFLASARRVPLPCGPVPPLPASSPPISQPCCLKYLFNLRCS